MGSWQKVNPLARVFNGVQEEYRGKQFIVTLEVYVFFFLSLFLIVIRIFNMRLTLLINFEVHNTVLLVS